jgi:ANTAR domain/PHP domain
MPAPRKVAHGSTAGRSPDRPFFPAPSPDPPRSLDRLVSPDQPRARSGSVVREVVERAKHLLMSQDGLSEPQAFRRLQKTSMDTRTPMVKVAEARRGRPARGRGAPSGPAPVANSSSPVGTVPHTQLALFPPPDPRGAAFPRLATDARTGRADLHVHSSWSDGAQAPQTLVKRAAKRLDVLAITDHDEIRGALVARQFARARPPPPGEGSMMVQFVHEVLETACSSSSGLLLSRGGDARV